MFRDKSTKQEARARRQTDFMESFTAAAEQPFSIPSEDTLEGFLTVVRIRGGQVTREELLKIEQKTHTEMHLTCQKIIQSPGFLQIITMLQLALEQAQTLSVRKLGALLTASDHRSVARLFNAFYSAGLSFEDIANLEDKKFELVIGSASQLLKLSQQNIPYIPLNKYLDLNYLETWALVMTPSSSEHELVTTNRQAAIDRLNSYSQGLTL